ncbi:MAG: HAD family hydrolase [Ruminococcaceae bacterium]|nr:HAD family hydrolase [Oscillospiraceae bacterium]HHV32847.1 HAD-IA family hydrolase [Clostridiales bacterium]
MYRFVAWDFDGTLFDTYPVMAGLFHKQLAEIGIQEPYLEIYRQMKKSMSHAFRYYRQKYGINEAFLEHYKESRRALELERCGPYPGIPELCRRIVETGGQNFLYTHRGDSALLLLEQYSMYDFFTDFITERHGFARKPSPDALMFLIQKHDLNPEQTIMIGDRDLDILAAKNAGVHSCFFQDDSKETYEYADYNIDSFTQLETILWGSEKNFRAQG